MRSYTNAEMTDMVLMYGRTFGNGLETRRLYGRNLPDHGTFNAVVHICHWRNKSIMYGYFFVRMMQ